jgi:hypothetical protein
VRLHNKTILTIIELLFLQGEIKMKLEKINHVIHQLSLREKRGFSSSSSSINLL